MVISFVVGLILGAYFSEQVVGAVVWVKTKVSGLFSPKK